MTGVAGTIRDVQFFGGTSHVLVDVDGFGASDRRHERRADATPARRRRRVVVAAKRPRRRRRHDSGTSRHVPRLAPGARSIMSSPTITRQLVDPATGEPFRRSPTPRSPTSTASSRAAPRPSGSWATALAVATVAGPVPPRRPRRSARPTSSVALEVAETGKPWAVMRDGELPFAVDNLRFFAAAARSLDGTAAGCGQRRLHVDAAAPARRRRCRDHAVELSAGDGRVEGRGRARGRMQRRAQAGAGHAVDVDRGSPSWPARLAYPPTCSASSRATPRSAKRS